MTPETRQVERGGKQGKGGEGGGGGWYSGDSVCFKLLGIDGTT